MCTASFSFCPEPNEKFIYAISSPLSQCQRDDALGVSGRVYNERRVYAAERSSGNEVMHSCNKLPGYLPKFPAGRHVSY